HCSERLMEIQPASPVALEGAALAAFARRAFDAAFRFCASLVEAHPAHFAGWFNCGVALQKLGLFEKAADAYSRAASLDPQAFEACLAFPTKYPEALLNMGIAYWKMRNIEMAKATFRQSLSTSRSTEALRRLAAIALQQQDYEQALTLHKQLLELDDPTSDLLYNLALLLQKRGRAEEAVRYYRK